VKEREFAFLMGAIAGIGTGLIIVGIVLALVVS